MKSKRLNVTLSIFFIIGSLINLLKAVVYLIWDVKFLAYHHYKIDYFEKERFLDILRNIVGNPLFKIVLFISIILILLGYLFYILNTELKKNFKKVFMSIIIPLIILMGVIHHMLSFSNDVSQGIITSFYIFSLLLSISYITFLSFELIYFKKTPRIAFIIHLSLLIIFRVVLWINEYTYKNLVLTYRGSEVFINMIKQWLIADVLNILVLLSFIIFAIINMVKNKKIQIDGSE